DVHELRVSRNTGVGAWVGAGGGLSSRAWTLLPDGESLIVGGTFVSAGGQTVNRIARWDGETWTRFGDGLNGGVLASTWFGGDLVVAGGFTRAVGDSTPMLRVARWDGARWQPMGAGFNRQVKALAVVNGVLYAGGD